ncbi:hypothetical protein J7384_18915 [Endozoicomonas sp. G2_1]|uniref:hypothetical protein n=1 Tax=Endozoicomonas sp. G2_1 TaxID=2821091 RepID=UPI001ADB3CF4|nr:hypothetical protein [Endozoicomonas sp. G2_1]MBO9492441.1 hypothetical protein [Endozoicomonas sp. G2_1]
MEIDLKSILSIIAICISSVSLYISLKSSKHSQKAKNAELRVSLLNKYAEVKSKAIDLFSYLSGVQKQAIEKNDLALYRIVEDTEAASRIIKKIEAQHDRVKNSPTSMGVELYDLIYSDIYEVTQDILQTREKAERLVSNYLSSKTDESTPNK